jgi:hypothetical protein
MTRHTDHTLTHIFSAMHCMYTAAIQVWVVNKTGVALAYRAPASAVKKGRGRAAAAAQALALQQGTRTSDAQVARVFGLDTDLPVMLHCRAKVSYT